MLFAIAEAAVKLCVRCFRVDALTTLGLQHGSKQRMNAQGESHFPDGCGGLWSLELAFKVVVRIILVEGLLALIVPHELSNCLDRAKHPVKHKTACSLCTNPLPGVLTMAHESKASASQNA